MLNWFASLFAKETQWEFPSLDEWHNMILKTTILIGWPERREEVPVQIREYWNYREELTLHNGILFKNQRVIIPNALRPELTTRAHSSHQGIEACIRRAKDVVFWPSMTKDIKEAVNVRYAQHSKWRMLSSQCRHMKYLIDDGAEFHQTSSLWTATSMLCLQTATQIS